MKKFWVIGFILGVMAIVVMPAHAAYEGRVVDSETKEPIEGVVVFIEWTQPHAGAGRTYLDAHETLTDKDGRFSLPGYKSFNLWKMFWAQSMVVLFKSGYQPIGPGLRAAFEKVEWGAPKGTYIWKWEDGKPVILLQKASTDIEKRLSSLRSVSPGGPANKKQVLLNEIKKEREFLMSCKATNQC